MPISDDALPPTRAVAEFVQRVLREVRGTREDYQCRHCGHMMSAHDMSTLGSVFCPGELDGAFKGGSTVCP